MSRRGYSLTEIMIASVILILVLIVIYATFMAGDRFYQNESVLRDAQFNVRRDLEQINQEISEGTPPAIWKRTDPTIATGPNKALIFLSGRDPDDTNSFSGVSPQDIHNPASGPMFTVTWLAFVVYAPYPIAGGKFELRRYVIKLPPPGISTAPATLTVTFTAASITLAGYGTITRSGGAKVLDDLITFEVGPPATPTAAFNDPPGAPLLPTSYMVTLERRVQITPSSSSNVKLTTTTKGRN